MPDCNLQSPALQDNLAAGGDLCGVPNNANFFAFSQNHSLGTATVVNPALLSGWGVRPFDWQFSASVQQQLLPRVSAEIGYSRRSWGNFTYTDNRAVAASDFDTYTMTVPTDIGCPTAASRSRMR